MNVTRGQRPDKARLGAVLHCAISGGTPCRAVKVAVVVGSILVIINQWDACFGQMPFDWVKVGLNYLVPYMVSTYTSVSKDLQASRSIAVAITDSTNPVTTKPASQPPVPNARRKGSC